MTRLREAAARLAFLQAGGVAGQAPGLPVVGSLPLPAPGLTGLEEVHVQRLSWETQKRREGPAPRDPAARALPATGGPRTVIRKEPPSSLCDTDVHALRPPGRSHR